MIISQHMVSGDLEFGSKSITFRGQLRTHIPVNLVPPKKCKEENPARSKSSSKTKKSSNKPARPLPPPPTPLLPPPPPPPSLSFSTAPTPTPLPRRSASASPPSYMEVEVKLRLPDSESHTRLKSILSPFLLKTLQQQNLFFDTTNSALSSQRSVLRLRFLDGDSRCILSLKCRPVLVNGVSRVEEDEEELQPSIGRECVDDPTRMGVIQSRILKRVKEEFDVGSEDGFVGLGGFENVRDVYEWKGLTLEVDETKYDFGTCYELECETSDPESVKKLLEEFLKENGIRYSHSQMSKFAVFRSQKLPQ